MHQGEPGSREKTLIMPSGCSQFISFQSQICGAVARAGLCRTPIQVKLDDVHMHVATPQPDRSPFVSRLVSQRVVKVASKYSRCLLNS